MQLLPLSWSCTTLTLVNPGDVPAASLIGATETSVVGAAFLVEVEFGGASASAMLVVFLQTYLQKSPLMVLVEIRLIGALRRLAVLRRVL